MYESLRRKYLRSIDSEEAATTVEYAILIAVIIVFAISGVMGTGDAQQAIWHDTSSALQVIRPGE